MKPRTSALFASLSLALFASRAKASHMAGRIGFVQVKWGGIVIVFIDGPRTGTSPACATDQTRYAFNSSTAEGQSKLAAVLTAQARGAAVAIWGDPVCTSWSDTEELGTIQISP